MHASKSAGIIIKRKDVGEADKILTILTIDLGKIQVKAKGVRKIASKRASHIELLNFTQFSLHKGNIMPILLEAESIESYFAIKSNLSRVGLAYHICELVDSLCPENQESRQIFHLLKNVLDQLSSQQQVGKLIHEFEIELLRLLGYYSDQDLSGSKASIYIESILERRLKSRQILHHLL